MLAATIRARVTSVCVAAGFSATDNPFDFREQPTGGIDLALRVTTNGGEVLGGIAFTEERTDIFEIWVARKQGADPEAAYQALLADAAVLRAAVIRDGATGGGDYAVPDAGAAHDIQHDPGAEYAVLRLALPINYEVTL